MDNPPMINVVGAGIAGSLVARALRQDGHPVRVFDDGDPHSASRASSNLYIDHWLKKFGSGEARVGIKVLESLFPPEAIDQPFSRGLAYAAKVRHIAQHHLLVQPDVIAQIGAVRQFPQEELGVRSEAGTIWPGPVVLCVGYRAPEFFPQMKLSVKVGHCLHLRGRLRPNQSSITLASPYVHSKLYQLDDDTIYFADSVSVSEEAYSRRNKELLRRTMDRAKKLLGQDDLDVKQILVGYRPIVEGFEFGHLWRPMPGVWSLNGGGKNGMVAYASLLPELRLEVAQWREVNGL